MFVLIYLMNSHLLQKSGWIGTGGLIQANEAKKIKIKIVKVKSSSHLSKF